MTNKVMKYCLSWVCFFSE